MDFSFSWLTSWSITVVFRDTLGLSTRTRTRGAGSDGSSVRLPSDRLPQNLRDVGIAWIVKETADNAELAANAMDGLMPEEFAHKVMAYASTWALLRGLPVSTDEHTQAAVEDARNYVAEHGDELDEFRRLMGR